MTDAKLDELEAIAKVATRGEWKCCETEYYMARWFEVESETGHVADCQGGSDEDARHIAAASPDVALALIAEVRRLRVETADAKASELFYCRRGEERYAEGFRAGLAKGGTPSVAINEAYDEGFRDGSIDARLPARDRPTRPA